eukprot:TRINITY_DN29227_c0_g1_i1.p1 TRINITY_DN29227_c0_g1~~TRINITY_DN29227_c0_g1_i1.p1  ORF type:complete len:304 (+),score=77.17 TRINITY_DN29227_c0_g1_i1:68-913(+)
MSLLGASYDSDEDSEDAANDGKLPAAKLGGPSLPSAASPDSSEGDAAAGAPKKRKIDYSKLPMSRPLALDASEPLEDAPLKKAAEAARSNFGSSLLASLPAPKVTLGKDKSQNGSVRIDLSEVVRPPREKDRTPVADLLRPDNFKDAVEEAAEVPANVLNHPMFRSDTAKPDGPSADDLSDLRRPRQFIKDIKADDMKDPDWYMKDQIASATQGKNVSDELSMYDGKGWRQTTHANPSRVQKRKHQINWLATEAMEKEAEMLDRGSQKNLSKAQTSAKYGW